MLKSVLQEPRLMDALRWDEIEELFTLDTCKQPRRCLSSRGLFSVDEVDPNVFKKLFRFRKSDIHVLANALQIPKTVRTPQRAVRLEGLFGRHSSVISSACIIVYDHIVDKFGHLLADLTTHKWLGAGSLKVLAQAAVEALRRNSPCCTPQALQPKNEHCPASCGVGLRKIANEFAFVDYKKNQKLMLQKVPTQYKAATILANCHTCMYGSQVSAYFDLEPPCLGQYLVVEQHS
ncbi:hypothetical protein HPB48_020607 [Haemaphysalis longicornis]|uniref:Uncharacterized protein n=1 Tax=Haemaphysalis longicornis TaxID=44386 RepID=A0A9J6G8W4_HAELO|nr:hypothetical protein HPB48_020607 [Haemaphysalis longicornis]